ncbi:MAG TPA: DUF3014 domain-containing protein [Burkholderiales bacterium]|nr:DUF3014 domain-containing protein [Burkholderiales bacterium]
MRDPIKWTVVVLGLAGVVAIFYPRWYSQVPEPQVEPPVHTETQPVPETKAKPQILHPIAEAGEPGNEVKPLPALSESDAAMQESLAGLVGQKTLTEFFYLNDIIRRIVATVDNLPRAKVALRLMPVKPVARKFLVTGEEDNFVLNPDNYSRYAPYVRLAEAVSVKKLVAVYVRFYPLFQQAYKDLGYPSGYFNDRLVEVIDHLLAAPEVQGPVKLVQPRVMYQFADPELEALSAGHKILVRMGSENAAGIKAKLKEIRPELTGQELKQ